MAASPVALSKVPEGRERRPEADCEEGGVEEGYELAHDGDEVQPRVLAALADASVEAGLRRVEADCVEGGHIDSVPGIGTLAAHMAVAFVRAAVAGARIHAGPGPGVMEASGSSSRASPRRLGFYLGHRPASTRAAPSRSPPAGTLSARRPYSSRCANRVYPPELDQVSNAHRGH